MYQIMSASNWEIWGLIIAILEFDINFYIYQKTASLLNVIIVIGASIIFALAFILSNIYMKIKEIEEKEEEISKKIIRDKELEDIRLDLREIKREIFKRR